MEASAQAAAGGQFDSDDLLSTEETALRLRCSANTLARWRGELRGPKWVRIGPKRVAYRSSDIAAFLSPNEAV